VEDLPPQCIAGWTTLCKIIGVVVSSRLDRAEAIDMGHAGSVREERIMVETDARVRELSRIL
jgi:hypothetical protein